MGTVPRALEHEFAAARAICSRHAKSFYFASQFLPRPKRDYAYAVYAYCRLMDDAVDVPGEDDVHAALEGAPVLLDQIYSGRISDGASERTAALRAFAYTVQECHIPRQYFLDLIEGCRMDLTITRYQTWRDLEKYCYHVAGVVGVIMCRVFALENQQAEQQAVAMGNAMQLTNILRDLREDDLRGRIYLPFQDMERFGYHEEDLQACVVNDSFRQLMRFQIARARRLYDEGAAGLCWLANDGSRLTASVMAAVYSGILQAIEKQGLDVFRARAHLSFFGKLQRLPRAWRTNQREAGDALPVGWA